jgi:hypothetical protein
MPQIVKPEARHFQTFKPREVVAVTKVARVERSAKLAHEQQSAVPVLWPEFETLLPLPQERSTELFRLFAGLRTLYDLHGEHGIPRGRVSFVRMEAGLAARVQFEPEPLACLERRKSLAGNGLSPGLCFFR